MLMVAQVVQKRCAQLMILQMQVVLAARSTLASSSAAQLGKHAVVGLCLLEGLWLAQVQYALTQSLQMKIAYVVLASKLAQRSKNRGVILTLK